MGEASVKNHFELPDANNDNKLVIEGSMESAGGGDLKTKLVTFSIGDVSTAGVLWISPGIAGTLVKITSIIDTAITAADAVLSFQIDEMAVTDGDITITQSGSAAGQVNQSFPTANNILLSDEGIKVTKDGGSTTTSNAVVTFEILPS